MDGILAVTGDGKPEEERETAGSAPVTFGQLYDAHLTDLYRYFLAHTGSDNEAADLTQQVFVQALSAWPRFSGATDTVRPWIFRIARNTLIDSYRRRRPAVAWDDVPFEAQPVAGDDTEASVLQRDETRKLVTAERELPTGKRELLIMRFVAGLTVREIAAAVDRKEGAVRSEIRRVLQQLKETMTDE